MDTTLGELEERIRARWAEFVEKDLPVLVAPIREASASIWASAAEGEATSKAMAGLASEAVQGLGPVTESI